MGEHIHDKGYKRILSTKEQFSVLLKDYLKLPWAQSFGLEDMELIETEFVLKDFEDKEADIIYKLRINGREVLVYCLLELQSTVDYTMPFRLLTYMTELLRRVFADTAVELRKLKSYRLPAVIPIVLYNGADSWTAEMNFKNYQSGSDMFEGYTLDFRYHLIDVNRYDSVWLQEIGGLLSAVFLLDGVKKGSHVPQALEKIYNMYSDLSGDEQIALMDWIRDVFSKKIPAGSREEVEGVLARLKGDAEIMTYAIERVWDKEMAESRDEGIAEGKIKGKAEGIVEGKIEGIVNIIKKLNIPLSEAMQILELPESELENVISELERQKVVYEK